MDLFEREQRIYDNAMNHITEVQNSVDYDYEKGFESFKALAKEYGKLLKQLRRITRISDKTAVDLNTSKLDLMDKVHYDPLTGIYNRRYMDDALKRVIKTISRSGGMLSVLMIDVDFFKRYNDTYGHGLGDICLKAIADTLKNTITRAADFAVRYGGEEFLVVLPDTGESGACLIADKLLRGVRNLNIPHEKNDAAGYVTISIGVTSSTVVHTQKNSDYIEQADKALYMSKQNGRNRYTFINLTVQGTRPNYTEGRQ